MGDVTAELIGCVPTVQQEGGAMAIKKGVSVLFAGALLSGGGAAYFTNGYINEQIAEFKQSLRKQYEPQTVVVPTVDLRAGENVSTRVLAAREVPGDFLHADAVRPNDLDSVVGLELVGPVRQGTPLLMSHLGKRQRKSAFAGLIEDGKRALTFPVDVVSSISGFLKPGDRIDLLATLRDGDKPITMPLFRNVNIMAAGTVVSERDAEGGPRRFQTVTLMVTPKDAAKIVHAQEVSRLTATLRSPSDERDVDVTPVTIDTLLGRTPAKQQRKRRSRPGVDVIIGGRT